MFFLTMDASKKVLFSLLVCSCVAISTSLPFPETKGDRSETYINCNDLSLVRKMESVGISFSCLQNADENILNSLPLDPSANDIGPSTKKMFASSEEKKISTPVPECSDGYTFIPEKNDCILSQVLLQESQSEGDSIPNVESLGSHKCEEGYVFNLDKGECVPDSKISSINFKHMIPKDADEEIITTLKCKAGTVYASQVDLCLPINPEAIAEPPELESVEIAFVPHPTKGCPKGSVYSPEIDHCLKIQMPPKSAVPKDDVKSVFISSDNFPSVIYDATVSKKHDYEDASRGVRDVPDEKRKQEDKRSASDPTQLSLQPLTHEAVGWNMCKPGEVYVSEIDLCLKP